MRYRKKYGESRVLECPFCGKEAVVKNPQGVPVCPKHRNFELKNLKCACGDYLDIKTGKWGAFGVCMHCGAINMNKVLEINPQILPKKEKKAEPEPEKKKKKPTRVVVTSDELDFLY